MTKLLTVGLLVLLAAPAAAQDIGHAIAVMREVAARCPRAYANAHGNHNTHPERLDYIILATQALKRVDGRFGLNGKRGVSSDPSADAIAYGSGRDVLVIDVIAAAGEHGGNLDAITWQDVTAFGPGVYVDPDGHRPVVPCGEPVPPPGPFPGADWEAKHAEVLMRFGASATTQTVAEQLAFLWPSEGWGQKAADVGRPISQDVIARRYADGRLVGFRVVPASAHPMQFDLTGQHYIPVAGVDHLGMGTAPPPPIEPPPPPVEPPPPPPPGGSLEDVVRVLIERVMALERVIERLRDALRQEN